jgi:lysophospholipase L1-like esterase
VNGHSNPSPGTGDGRLEFWLDGKAVDANSPIVATAGRPDVILLHAGTNDLNPAGDQNPQWQDIDSIRTVIASWSSANWPVTIIYSRIVNIRDTPNLETITFNTNVIDNLSPTIWVNHEAALNDPMFYGDTIHPNTSGYQAMADVWLYPLAGIGTPSVGYSGTGILPKCP